MQQMREALKDAGVVQQRPNAERPKPTEVDLPTHLKNGGRCVIVGGKASNFSDAMRKHAQLVFFDSTDPKARDKEMPSNTRAVLFCAGWHDHGWEWRIRRQARDRAIYCPPGWQSTGDLRDILQRFLDSPAAVAPIPPAIVDHELSTPVHVEPAPKPDVPAPFVPIENVKFETPLTHEEQEQPIVTKNNNRSWLRDFVAKHADLDAVPQIAEANRVLALLRKEGGKSTAISVANTMYQLRMAAGKAKMKGGGDTSQYKRDRTIRNAGIMPTAEPVAPVTSRPAARGDGKVRDGYHDVLTLATDAVAQMEQAKAAMQLVVDALEKLQTQDKERIELLARVRAALGE